MNFADRFWRRVRRSLACWTWTGTTVKSGHGHVRRAGRMVLAHRAAWELAIGPIPDGLCVLHRCDHPSCVRPSHLFLGTPADNTADMVWKRRHRFGERARDARLSASDVECARALNRAGASQRSLSIVFGVSHTSMRKAVLGHHWRSVESQCADPCTPRTHCPSGHEFTEENTLRWGPRLSFRKCRTCMRALRAEQRAAERCDLTLHEYRASVQR